jgi:hypothetical protein
MISRSFAIKNIFGIAFAFFTSLFWGMDTPLAPYTPPQLGKYLGFSDKEEYKEFFENTAEQEKKETERFFYRQFPQAAHNNNQIAQCITLVIQSLSQARGYFEALKLAKGLHNSPEIIVSLEQMFREKYTTAERHLADYLENAPLKKKPASILILNQFLCPQDSPHPLWLHPFLCSAGRH